MRVLMCEPRYLPRLKGARSWLADAPPLDVDVARRQWQGLVELVAAEVAPVELLPAEPWAPAMTFTRDLGVAADGRTYALNPASLRGPFEAPLVRRHLGGSETAGELPAIDGGNVLADAHGRLLIGVTPGSAGELRPVAADLSAMTGRPAVGVPLSGGRFPHVDMAIADLGGRGWLVYPDALRGFDADDDAWRRLFLDRPVISVERADGERLACNVVVGKDTVIGPPITDNLERSIGDIGFAYVATPLDELLKAGGGAHCLTLELK